MKEVKKEEKRFMNLPATNSAAVVPRRHFPQMMLRPGRRRLRLGTWDRSDMGFVFGTSALLQIINVSYNS